MEGEQKRRKGKCKKDGEWKPRGGSLKTLKHRNSSKNYVNQYNSPFSSDFCLLCSEKLARNMEGNGGGVLDIPGAEKCTELSVNLEKMFILRKILNVPGNWIADNLMKNWELEVKGDGCGGVLRFCRKCMEGSVAKAWNIYQQLVEVHQKWNGIRKELVMGIKRKTEEGLGDKRRRRFRQGTHEFQIRQYLFPGKYYFFIVFNFNYNFCEINLFPIFFRTICNRKSGTS